MTSGADFSDLAARIGSAAVMLLIGLGALWAGGQAWAAVLIAAAGLMGWEVSRMHANAAQTPMILGALLAAIVALCLYFPPAWSAIAGLAAAGIGLTLHKSRLTVIAWCAAIVATALVLNVLRVNFGVPTTVWLLLVVIGSDVGGYFAGKLIGGPKILPRISPKKTWSGTLGGWALAALVGWGAWRLGIGGAEMIPLSVLLAMAAQLGDLAESLMKRRAGVKDSSALIPGHGGLLDRFDGTTGAAIVMGAAILTGVMA